MPQGRHRPDRGHGECHGEDTELAGVSLNDLGHGELCCGADTDLTGVMVNYVAGKTQN